MIYNGWVGDTLLFQPEDVVICPLPLFHVFATEVVLMSMIASGGHVVLPTPAGYRGDGVFDNFWKLIERWKVTFIITVPTAISALMQRPVDADVSSVKQAFSGSAPLPVELYNRFENASGVEIIEGYGLTEATCLVSCNPIGGTKKIGSVGIPFPYTDVRILKHDNGTVRECVTDEVGEICIDSPGVFPGSTYTELDKNRDLFHHEVYLRTGDLGRIDADGYLWITGRAKDSDHPRRPQHRSRDDRGCLAGSRSGGDGRRDRATRCAFGRASLRLCRADLGRDDDGRGTAGVCARPNR